MFTREGAFVEILDRDVGFMLFFAQIDQPTYL